ncbi:CoA-transferase family III [Penicillium pulvis]|uniref:CoA-transferase family III n=1 Tax=Penicillium pulvis TaxID=1562058 RepID=UPI002547FB4E|nr:CoA-transferase family III [Penicillium pulvis]KAJ5798545.1 CoA-transferase family III [Penicillium pulvis]
MTTMFLADYGADVIHIDPPSGPPWRHSANAALHRGKRYIRLDLKTEEGLSQARRLMTSADIIVENFRPGVMRKLGLDPEVAIESNPGLVWCSMPGFPSDDPRASMQAWEGIVCAAVGLYPSLGFGAGGGEGDPVFTALPLASNYAAFLAAHRIVAALRTRQRFGRGEVMEVSLFEAGFQGLGFGAEDPPSRTLSNTLVVKMPAAMGVRKAGDNNYVYIDSPLRGLQRLLNKFLPGRDIRSMHKVEILELSDDLNKLLSAKPAREWEQLCQEELEGALGLAQPVSAWLEDKHALDSECVIQVEDCEYGETFQAGFATRLSVSRPFVRGGRHSEPLPGGEQIEWLEPQMERPVIDVVAPTPPLAGLRVLDLSTLLAGPTTARILVQHGAEVIKIDRPGIITGDVDPLTDDEVAFIGARTVSAGKRMMFLDLKSLKGRDILAALIAKSDVVHHNFTPKAALRLGVDEQSVRGINPSIIMSTMSLHSYGGFREAYRGHDMLGQMVTGMAHRHGGTAGPQIQSTYLNDNAAGHLNAFGIILALLHRDATGQGQAVNASLSRTATLHQLPYMMKYAGWTGDEPSGPGSPGWNEFDRLYKARDGWFYLAEGHEKGRQLLEAQSGFEKLATVPARDVAIWLEAKFERICVADCIAILLQAGLSAHRYCGLQELAGDVEVVRNNLLPTIHHQGLGLARGIGLPVYSSVDREKSLLKARRPGSDTINVLIEHGFADEIDHLLMDRIIATDEANILNMV